MPDTPYLFNWTAPPLVCSRWMGDGGCGQPAEFHVIWDESLNNGMCCKEHMVEALDRWGVYAFHDYDPVCSIAGARYNHQRNRCEADFGDLPTLTEKRELHLV